MKRILLLLSIFSYVACNHHAAPVSIDGARIVKSGLDHPWEITWGKDDHIWMTERDGKISRIDPSSGNVSFSFTVPDAESNNEGGLLGMALHPDFAQNGFLYAVYDYYNGGNYREKLVRYTYWMA